MTRGIIPFLLLLASTGLALSKTRLSNAVYAFGLLVVTAALVMLRSPFHGASEQAPFGVWISVIGPAALTYMRKDVPLPLALLVAANAGVWSGVLAADHSRGFQLLILLPFALLFLPGRALVDRGYPIALRVAASWLMAISLLMVFVSMTPTPGYAPDHME